MKYIDQYQGAEFSFWECFPQFSEVKPFKDLYKADRSAGKNKSSKVMWFLVLCCDIDSEFYTFSWKEHKKNMLDVLGIDIIKYIGEEAKVLELKDQFEKFIDTVITSDIRAKERKLQERQEFIGNTPYSLDHYDEDENGKRFLVKGTASDLDKMVVGTGKLHEEIRRLREAAKNEQSEAGLGGQESSFLERR